MPRRIVSGGQTGADRAGLDAAIELGLEHGGWCPRGRRAEDGTIPSRYCLRETETSEYAARTTRNVEEADATVLFTRGRPSGGSALTAQVAAARRKPLLAIDLAALSEAEAAAQLQAFLTANRVTVLNVAGSRESQAAGIGDAVRRIALRAFRG